MRRTRYILLAALAVLALLAGCSHADPAVKRDGLSGKLLIFHAGSLSVPFKEMAAEFAAEHPSVKVERIAGGSLAMIRQVTELGKRVDIVASADYSAIPKMMYPRYADWTIRFATNRMVIAFTESSKFANEINGDNWYEILQRPGVRFGHADPNMDPCGYRTLMVWKLAEKYYGVPGLYESLNKACPAANVRPKSVELLALLESGELDYAFEYQSVAVQHGLKYINLPKEIDLSDPHLDDRYSSAVVEVAGKAPGEKIRLRGSAITYGLTIPKVAMNREAAVEFVKFCLGEKGRAILEKNGQEPLVPPLVDKPEKLPKELEPLVSPSK